MKCFIENFMELDIDELLAVNGGYGNSSGSYGTTSSSGSGNQSSWDVWVANKDGRNSSGEITQPYDPYKNAPINSGNYKETSFVPDISGGEKIEKQVTVNPNNYHCDIKAWNAAIDAGFDPRGSDDVSWDGNNKTVNELLTFKRRAL